MDSKDSLIDLFRVYLVIVTSPSQQDELKPRFGETGLWRYQGHAVYKNTRTAIMAYQGEAPQGSQGAGPEATRDLGMGRPIWAFDKSYWSSKICAQQSVYTGVRCTLPTSKRANLLQRQSFRSADQDRHKRQQLGET